MVGKTSRSIIAAVLLVSAGAAGSFGAEKKKDEDAGLRSVQGVVRDPADNIVEGAVVQLKNTKTLQVRSFITQQDGTYLFQGISTNIDYELKADHGGATSGVKRLSAFDNRSKAVINLKLEKK
jgi:hypothetical protein